jgi:hypothetical protein
MTTSFFPAVVPQQPALYQLRRGEPPVSGASALTLTIVACSFNGHHRW